MPRYLTAKSAASSRKTWKLKKAAVERRAWVALQNAHMKKSRRAAALANARRNFAASKITAAFRKRGAWAGSKSRFKKIGKKTKDTWNYKYFGKPPGVSWGWFNGVK